MKRLLLLGVLALASCGLAVAGGGPAAASTVVPAAATSPPPSASPSPTASPATSTASPAPATATQQASATPAPAPTTGVPTSSSPTTGESWAAALAILGAIGLGAGILWLVNRVHTLQKSLAQATIRRGGSVQVQTQSTTGGGKELGEAAGTPAPLTITGPDEVQVNTPGEFIVEPVDNPQWGVTGISAYARDLKDPRTFVFTPHEEKDAVTIGVSGSAGRSGSKTVRVLPAVPPAPFVLELVVRNWGLVLIAVAVVFGAIALGLTGHLTGGNFVALVAPVAALLGVTAATAGRSGGGDGAKQK